MDGRLFYIFSVIIIGLNQLSRANMHPLGQSDQLKGY